MNETARIIISVSAALLTVLFGVQWVYTNLLNKQLQTKQSMMRIFHPRQTTFAAAIKVLIPATVFLIAVSVSTGLSYTTVNGLEVTTIQSESELRELLSEYAQGGNPLMPGLATTAMRIESAGADSFTETNVQVPGVDEIDNVKTDGRFIYQTRYNHLTSQEEVVITRAWPVSALSVEQIIPLQNDVDCYLDDTVEFCIYETLEGLYVDEDRLIVILSRSVFPNDAHQPPNDVRASTEEFTILPWFGGWSTDTVVRDYDKGNDFALTNEYVFEGSMIGTRKMDDHLFVITNNFIHPEDDDLLPRYVVNNTVVTTAYNNINYVRDTMPTGFTSLYGIDLVTQEVADQHLLSSSSSTMHVSQNNIYLLDQRYLSIARLAFFIDQGQDVEEPRTRVTRFELTGHTIALASAGEFIGTPLNPFSMDEQDGFLRVTTTTGWGEATNNRLIILDKNLQVVSTIEGLGKPNERLQSTRFVGERAYLVTFDMTDPFYVVEVADPFNPVVLGELEITGFSSYLQPLDATHILGIGFDADPQGQILGLKLAIYDVSDPANPVEKSQALLSYDAFGWSSASVTYNHKDLLLDLNNHIIGFPFQSYQPLMNVSQNGYMVYSFQALALTLEAFIEHSESGGWNNQMQKGLILDDYLYTVSFGEVGITALEDVSTQLALLSTLTTETP